VNFWRRTAEVRRIAAVLAQRGRYRAIADHLPGNEARLPDDVGSDDDWVVVCVILEAADRDRAI
jgi:hypothetical protein